MKELYNQKHIQEFYDKYAELETQRWDRSIVEQCKLHVHQHYVNQYITSRDKVLELGSGTGIFTEQMATITNQLTVTDLSPRQLELNRERAKEKNYAESIQEWSIQDICDLSDYQDESFDKVTCYGGPLSYVFERKAEALAEIFRVLRPNGIALMSVMNRWGTVDQYLEDIVLEITKEENEKILESGNLHPSSHAPSDHHCHMFTKEELVNDLENTGFDLLVLSASNCLSSKRAESLDLLKSDNAKWQYFLDLELRACKSSGMEESGTHIISVVQRPKR